MDEKEKVRKFIEQNDELYKKLCDNSLLDSVIDLMIAYADNVAEATLEFSKNIVSKLLGKSEL